MKIAIIGAGFTGLAAGLKLLKAGHQVTIFEKDSFPGGLATGFRNPKWQWSLEKHYHHWFTSDDKVLNMAKEIDYPVIAKRPKTSVYVNYKSYKMDSSLDVLKFPKLNLFQRLRMGVVIAFLKYNPFWKLLEKYNVSTVLPKMMGRKAYKILWKPLLVKKFGLFAHDISLAWFWARIVKRTPSLVYPKGGFLEFANALVSEIEKAGGKVLFNYDVRKITTKQNGGIEVNNSIFDKIIVTTSFFLFLKMAPQLPKEYIKKISRLKNLGATNLLLCLKKAFFPDQTYWLNVNDPEFPLMAIVEHTNFMDKKYYSNEHLVYLGNYLPNDHPFMKMDKVELLRIYDPLLKKINKNYQSSIIESYLFTNPFAQPIIPTNYSGTIPPFETPLKNVYLANMQQVYPWDRGTNYAVELGEKIADFILNSQ